MTRGAGDSRKRSCPYHPGVVADTPCERCGRLFCTECVKDWNGKGLGPLCRRERVRRRVIIGAVVAVMLAAPAAVIVWGFDQHRRYGAARHRVRYRQKLLERFPRSTGLRLRLARDLLRAGNRDKARAELDRLLRDHPRHLGGLLARGRLAAAERDRAGALRYAVRAVGAAPRSRAARLAVARAHLALGRSDKAEDALRAGLQRDPRATDLALLLADILADGRRTAEALETLRRTLRHAAGAALRRTIQQRIQELCARAK